MRQGDKREGESKVTNQHGTWFAANETASEFADSEAEIDSELDDYFDEPPKANEASAPTTIRDRTRWGDPDVDPPF